MKEEKWSDQHMEMLAPLLVGVDTAKFSSEYSGVWVRVF